MIQPHCDRVRQKKMLLAHFLTFTKKIRNGRLWKFSFFVQCSLHKISENTGGYGLVKTGILEYFILTCVFLTKFERQTSKTLKQICFCLDLPTRCCINQSCLRTINWFPTNDSKEQNCTSIYL